MQVKEAMRRKKEWGDKPCGHNELDKEYYLGSATGDYVCTQCGESGSRSFFENAKHQSRRDK